jgi:hypothetical protein
VESFFSCSIDDRSRLFIVFHSLFQFAPGVYSFMHFFFARKLFFLFIIDRVVYVAGCQN